MKDILGYEGRTCVIVGAATGMGEACARTLTDMGAKVIAMDIAPVTAPVAEAIQVDLADPSSIDDAVAKLPAEVPSLFVCAAVPGPPRWDALATMRVNFVGVRHVIEAILPRIPKGGAVALISSVAGMGYKKQLERWTELMGIEDFEEAAAWCESHPEVANGYLGSKQALCVYTKMRASQLVEREIRMNCLLPSPTDTPMLPDFHEQAGGKDTLEEYFLSPIGRNATPAEMAEPLILLNSDAARFISGHSLVVDFGYCGEVDVAIRPELL